MQSRAIRTPVHLTLWLMVLSMVFVTCSDDSDCPTCRTCPTCPAPTEWVYYDNFDDLFLDATLWNYIPDC